MSTEPTGQQILDVTLGENDADAATIRDYLIALLTGLWREGEGFSGKRPFGNSGWEFELYDGLGKAGLIRAEFDVDGYLSGFDEQAADRLITRAIEALGGSS